MKFHYSNMLNFTNAETSAAEGELPPQPESPCGLEEDVLKCNQVGRSLPDFPATAQEGEGCAESFAPATAQQVSQEVLAQPSPAPIQQTVIEPPQQQPQPQPQTPPSETPEAQPQPQTKPQRMTRRQPDGTVVFDFDGKKETVAAGELDCWKPIDEIDEISLPSIEGLDFPQTIVLDIETTSLDAESGEVIAVGLLFGHGNGSVMVQIKDGSNEKSLLQGLFDVLKHYKSIVGGKEIILTGYNIFNFDLPFLIQRAEKLNIPCPFRFLRDKETGEIVYLRVAATEGTLKGEPISYPAIISDLPFILIDTQHLVCKWDYVAKVLPHYDLKSVADELGVAVKGRPILSHEEIQKAHKENKELLREYLKADLKETYEIFKKLIPPYLVISKLTNLPLHKVVTKGTAWMWEQILKQHYNYEPPAEEKVKYEGGLTASREGLWYPSLKLDVASLYPTIMLAYRIHSRKDTEQVALKWLKTLTKQRLALKAKAKEGDETAKVVQEGMKILINSLYGFYGTGGYGFNDMEAAAKIPKLGRKILTQMIAAAEEAGGIVVEADTDGIIVCYPHADPQTIFEAVQAAVPPPFKVELEWKDAICFVSDKKNYIVLTPSGDIIAVKGNKWRGRDKEAYSTKAIPTFLQIYATKGKEEAQRYADSVKEEISSGGGWGWVVRNHKVGKGDKFLIEAGFKVGEIATYAYKDKNKKIVSTNPDDGYDVAFYTKKFKELVDEVVAVIEQKSRKDKSKKKSKRTKRKS